MGGTGRSLRRQPEDTVQSKRILEVVRRLSRGLSTSHSPVKSRYSRIQKRAVFRGFGEPRHPNRRPVVSTSPTTQNQSQIFKYKDLIQFTPTDLGVFCTRRLIDFFTARIVKIFHAPRGDYLDNGSNGIVFVVNTEIVVKIVYRFDIHPPGYAEVEQYNLRRIKKKRCLNILAKPKNWHFNNYIALIYGEIPCVSPQHYNPIILLLTI